MKDASTRRINAERVTFNQKLEGTAWRSKPSWYIVGKNDRTLAIRRLKTVLAGILGEGKGIPKRATFWQQLFST